MYNTITLEEEIKGRIEERTRAILIENKINECTERITIIIKRRVIEPVIIDCFQRRYNDI